MMASEFKLRTDDISTHQICTCKYCGEHCYEVAQAFRGTAWTPGRLYPKTRTRSGTDVFRFQRTCRDFEESPWSSDMGRMVKSWNERNQ